MFWSKITLSSQETTEANQGFISNLLSTVFNAKSDHASPKPSATMTHRLSARDSSLYDLVIDMNWNRVVECCQAHPETAQFQEGDSFETPLHAAVQMRPPVRVISELIEAYPEALTVPSRNGDFPLHIACRYNASIEVLKELVADERADTARQETKWGSTSIVALWRIHGTLQVRDSSHYFWEKMRVLLEAVARSRDTEICKIKNGTRPSRSRSDNTLYVLHAAVSLGSLGCPNEVLDFCLQEYSNQVGMVDESGRLPLHLATGPTRWSCRSKRRYKPREQHTLDSLLRLYPEAARISDPNTPGRLPLHMALANRHVWDGGVRHLVQCYPDALVQADPVTGLLPFLASAAPVGDTVVDINTIYNTLRCLPAALEAARESSNQAAVLKAEEICTPVETKRRIRMNRALYAIGAIVGVTCVAMATYRETNEKLHSY